MTDDVAGPSAAATGKVVQALNVPQIGDRLLAGRYQVGQLIGRGGMAEVHMGTDTRLGRRVAIKLLRSSLANDPTFRIRFRQEAQAAARMTHPTIVRVFDAGEETVLETGGGEAQLPFIVMEYVDGKLLKDLIDQGPMSLPEAAHILTGLLTALEYSHRAGVVHRDIKPGNVMVTRGGQIKVMDFGIARAISDSSATVAQTTAILGTAQYFSPEQAKGETVDARSDIYSSGVVLYEMLTGRPPFSGDSPVAVAYQHVSEPPTPPGDITAGLSDDIDAVVLRALEKDKNVRYQTAEEFRADVEAVAAGRRPAARLPRELPSDDLFGGAVADADSAVRRLAFDDDSRQRTSNRPPAAWVWAGIACVLVVVIGVAVWVIGLTTGGFGADSRQVPAGLVNATESSASTALNRLDLVPVIHREASESIANGIVIRVSPVPGRTISKNSSVQLWISTGPPQTAVPDVVGQDTKSALAEITKAKLAGGEITQDHSPTVKQGVVLTQSPAKGERVTEGSSVDLVVSDGQVDMPDVRQEQLDTAQSQLQALDLQVKPEVVANCGAASTVVIGQSAPVGAIDQGSTVTLTYCGGN